MQMRPAQKSEDNSFGSGREFAREISSLVRCQIAFWSGVNDPRTSIFAAHSRAHLGRRESFAISLSLHALAVSLIAFSSTFVIIKKQEFKLQATGNIVDISPYVFGSSTKKTGGGGGGGDRDKLAAPKGALPKPAAEQITPPALIAPNEQPKLPVDPSVVLPPNITLPHIGTLGDPLSSVVGLLSNGTGSGGGIGSGNGGGVGAGRGPGVGPGWGGGFGGGAYRVGGGDSAPRIIYAPDPEFSEEARKANYQGTVVLWLIVGADGRPRDVRVVRSLGMGLDEEAVETVRTWKFEPAKKDGLSVAVQVNVEVTFRLY